MATQKPMSADDIEDVKRQRDWYRDRVIWRAHSSDGYASYIQGPAGEEDALLPFPDWLDANGANMMMKTIHRYKDQIRALKAALGVALFAFAFLVIVSIVLERTQ